MIEYFEFSAFIKEMKFKNFKFYGIKRNKI